nr:MAG TPA: Putative mitochondrial precursor protein [Caudoviricetes sp.]
MEEYTFVIGFITGALTVFAGIYVGSKISR